MIGSAGTGSGGIEPLLNEWRAAQFRRATGGLNALAGFDYQARVALADLAAGLVAGGSELASKGQVFVEALSDILRVEGPSMVCVQVKRTLTKQKLKDAADEIAAIDAFLRARSPNLAASTRYEAVASRTDGVTWSDLLSDAKLAPVLGPLVAEGRLLGPRIEPDPWWRLIATIYRKLDDPYAFARFALERIFARRDAAGDASAVRDAIAEEFARRRVAVTAPGRIYAPAELDHTTERPTRLAIGQLVTPERLRLGHYMLRPARIGPLQREVEQRRELQVAARPERAEVVWLQGRSGSGKSVLLVQLHEELVRAGRRVVWLGSEVDRLGVLLRQVADEPPDRAPEFVLVDDLYDPEARDMLDLAALGRFVEGQPEVVWPVVVTCGPAEFAASFRADAKHRGFDVHEVDVPLVGPEEAGRLASWYRALSGHEPRRGTAFDQAEQGSGLVVSMCVELEHADLTQFGAHFADRLEANGLTEALRVPLALARLYIWSPEAWFPQDVRERLDHLATTGDVTLVPQAAGARDVRLTHPHIANAIYTAVTSTLSGLARANDLVKAFRRALEARDGVLARRLLRALASGAEGGLLGPRLADVDLATVVRECAGLWLPATAAGTAWLGSGDAQADAAVSWTRLAVRYPWLDGMLGPPSTLERALSALDGAEVRWPSLWERLRRTAVNRDPVLAWARRRVVDPRVQTHPQWSFVWERCDPPAAEADDWLAAGKAWLSAAQHPPDWHFVWRKLVGSAATAEWARTIGHARLKVAPDRPEWAFVLQDLVADASARGDAGAVAGLLEAGWRWLAHREDRPEWAFVWRLVVERRAQLPPLLGVSEGTILEVGRSWLAGREDRPDWAFVWEHLVELAELPSAPGGTESALLEVGWYWLAGRQERPDWPFVWKFLVERHGELPSALGISEGTLLEKGVHWLAGREDRPEWSYVWKLLVEHHAQLPPTLGIAEDALLASGWRWLAGREDRSGWTHVWNVLVVRHAQLPPTLGVSEHALLTLGLDWLAGREDRSDWSHVWEAIVSRATRDGAGLPARRDALRRGWAWIQEHPAKPDAPVVWSRLVEHRDDLDAEIRHRVMEWGAAWLEQPGRLNDRSFGWVAEGLLDLEAVDSSRLAAIDSWLATTPHPSWSIIAAKRIRASPDDRGAAQVAARLTARVRNGAFLHSKVRRILAKLDGRDVPTEVAELRALAEELSPPKARKRTNGARRDPQEWAMPPVGSVVDAIVTGHQPYGVFAAVEGWPGLLHRKEIPAPGDDLERRFPRNTELRVRIIGHRDHKLALSLREDRSKPTGPLPPVGSEVVAVVTNHMDYGVFAATDGWSGLLHRTEIPGPTHDLRTRFPRGTKLTLWVIGHRDQKLVFSLRDVRSPQSTDA